MADSKIEKITLTPSQSAFLQEQRAILRGARLDGEEKAEGKMEDKMEDKAIEGALLIRMIRQGHIFYIDFLMQERKQEWWMDSAGQTLLHIVVLSMIEHQGMLEDLQRNKEFVRQCSAIRAFQKERKIRVDLISEKIKLNNGYKRIAEEKSTIAALNGCLASLEASFLDRNLATDLVRCLKLAQEKETLKTRIALKGKQLAILESEVRSLQNLFEEIENPHVDSMLQDIVAQEEKVKEISDIIKNQVEIFQRFLKKGAESVVNMPDARGVMVLDYATRRHRIEFMKPLLIAGADPILKSNSPRCLSVGQNHCVLKTAFLNIHEAQNHVLVVLKRKESILEKLHIKPIASFLEIQEKLLALDRQLSSAKKKLDLCYQQLFLLLQYCGEFPQGPDDARVTSFDMADIVMFPCSVASFVAYIQKHSSHESREHYPAIKWVYDRLVPFCQTQKALVSTSVSSVTDFFGCFFSAKKSTGSGKASREEQESLLHCVESGTPAAPVDAEIPVNYASSYYNWVASEFKVT